MNPNAHHEKRSEERLRSANAIAFAYLNRVEHYLGLAQDVSREGMFFFARRRLKPGTIVRIQPLDCQAPPPIWGDGHCRRMAADLCADEAPAIAARKDFANLVTAQVMRCEDLDDNTAWHYGVGVSFVRPAV